MLFGCMVLPDTKDTKRGNHLQVQSTRVVLVPFRAWRCAAMDLNVSRKLPKFSFLSSTGFTSFSVLLFFTRSMAPFFTVHGF